MRETLIMMLQRLVSEAAAGQHREQGPGKMMVVTATPGVVSTIGDQRYSSMHQQLNTFGRKVETASTDKEAVTEADTVDRWSTFLLQF